MSPLYDTTINDVKENRLDQTIYQNQIIAVFGHRGSGKTTWLFENINHFTPFIVVDPLYDPKFKMLNLYTIKSIDEAFDLFKIGDPRRCYITPNLATFDIFCGLCLARGNITLIVDEVDQFCTSQFMTSHFKELIKMGRHRQVNLIAACRRPHEMNPLIRSQASRFIIFPMGGEDAKHLDSYIKDIFSLCMQLKSGDIWSEYIDYDFRNKTATIKKINFIIT
jgi:hypothetical protein